VLLVTGSVLTWALLARLPEQDTRVLTFFTLVISDLGLIIANRGGSRSIFTAFRAANTALAVVLGGAVLLLIAVAAAPGLRDLFRFGALHPDDISVILLASLVSLLSLDVLRLIRRRSAHAS